MMEPFYFGPDRRALLGMYHPAATHTDRDTGVVLCNPFGGEYLYSHRALRQLAQRLAERGFHVLRFDYSCSGDSGGECEAADAQQWIEDVGLAIEELEERAGLDRVCLVGLRLGALVALHAASGRRDVEGLVLWEPVHSARAYLDELQAVHRSLTATLDFPTPETLEGGSVESVGFQLSNPFQESLAALDVRGTALRKPARRALVLRQAEASDPLVGELVRLGVKTEETVKRAPLSWLEWTADARVVVPGEVLQTIVEWLVQGAL
jgi:pimeloyl-ACP methyl ester carboxylesterase